MLSSATTTSTGGPPAGGYSRRSSVMTIPSMEGAHRLDLLISEHKSAVINAQSGLQQSLVILERANSKEEKESARIQVQSLLSRAEELLLLLRVISEIRCELKHVQEEILLAKKNHVNARPLYARQQWLEVRLEKLLLAKKRARPGARGQRTQLRPIQRQESKRKSLGTLSPSFSNSFDSFSDRDTTFSVRDSTLAPSTAGGGVAVASSSSSSSSSDDDETETSYRDSFEKVDWAASGGPPEGSDVWHSESEANWTLMEASLRNGRDIMQSQILSEGASVNDGSMLHQRRPSVTFNDSSLVPKQKETMPPFSEREEEEEEAKGAGTREQSLPEDVITPMERVAVDSDSALDSIASSADDSPKFNFLPPRSVEVFGSCSWNALPLAISSTHVQGKASPGGFRTYDEFMLNAGLDGFCSEVEVLRELIHKAAHATTVSGRLLSTTRRTALSSRASRSKTLPFAVSEVGVGTRQERRKSSVILPPLVDTSAAGRARVEMRNSRKLYGTELSAYPRSTDAWYAGRKRADSDSVLQVASEKDSPFKESPLDFQSSLRMRARPKSRVRSRMANRSRAATAADIFDRKLHKERQIEHLLHQAESSLAIVRRDSIQALGLLPQVGEKAKEKLQNALHTDEEVTVRYRALCSLLQLGVVNDGIITYIDFFLTEGSPRLKSDLLHLLCQDSILNLCLEKLPPEDRNVIQNLREILDYILQSGQDETDLPLYAALLLSHAHLSKDLCVEKLKCFLHSSTPSHQSMALKCLLKCWRCCDGDVIHMATLLMSQLCDWKLRREAVESLCEVGGEVVSYKGPGGQSIVDFLARRITNEPVLAVRLAIGRLLKSLQVDSKIEASFLSDLESNDEIVRSNAVLGLSGFELKGKKTIQHLLECVELDPSMYIRIQVIRLFGGMKHYNSAVVKCLRKKSEGQDPIARESKSALQNIFKNLERR